MSDARARLDIDEIVEEEIRGLLAATGRSVAAISHEERLMEGLGVTSFELAELVAALNKRLAADPFRQSLAFTDVQTVADLCRAYRAPPGAAHAPEGAADELNTSQRRAQARRTARQRRP